MEDCDLTSSVKHYSNSTQRSSSFESRVLKCTRITLWGHSAWPRRTEASDGKWSGDGCAPNVGGAPGMASSYCLRFPAIQVSPGFELVVREDHNKTRAARGPARS